MAEETGKTVRAFKGFNKDLKCRGFQYEIGKEYEIEGDVECCDNGFHACENPFDVFGFYPIIDDEGNFNRFCEVEGSGKADKKNEKTAFSKLKVKAEIGIKGFISAFIEIVKESVKAEKDDSDYSQLASSGDCSKLASSGYCSKLASSGYGSQLASFGYGSKLASSGDCSQLASSGYGSQLASSGDYSQLASSGDDSQLASSGDCSKLASSEYGSKLASSGDCSQLASSGDCSKLASSGDDSKLASSGKHSVICCAGNNSKAKAKKGSWITLSEWKYDENEEKYIPVCVKTEFVDGEKIKEDTFYILRDGEFKEVINE
ncbi:MAG: hypothetical protein IIZ78_23020 [Clostridiales bacterium]|nr:hypothetical protein [Clostridiales bacterium]